MTVLTMTRFNRTAGGYRRHDTHEIESGQNFAFLLNQVCDLMRENERGNEPTAISFSRFDAGRMSGETWRSASAIVLEYMVGGKGDERLAEVRAAAAKGDYAYYLLSTQTRYGQPTLTLVFPMTQHVSVAHYSRIASVLATRLDLYDAAPGIQAHTHLFHVADYSEATYEHGLLINPEQFISLTEKEAQKLDPLQFEGERPRKKAQPEKLHELFEGL